MNYLQQRKAAFTYALKGLLSSVKKESHMRIHMAAAVLAICAGWLLGISSREWIAVTACICLVMICELLNTAIERICDLISPQPDPSIGYIKDISAGAVLLACLFAVITGMVVFIPRLLILWPR